MVNSREELSKSAHLIAEENASFAGKTTEEAPLTQRQRRSEMSNEDNDDVNDIMDESAARGAPTGSGIQALGMNGSELNGKSDPDNINADDDKDEVASEDAGEEDYQEDDEPVVGTARLEDSRGGFWGAKNRPKGIVASGGIIGVDGNPILGSSSRPVSPGMMDNLSDISSQLPINAPLTRSKSRSDFNSGNGASVVPSAGGGSTRYPSNFWKARRVLFYRNGDPFFPGIEYRFKPGRDVTTIEALLDKISPRMDLPRGARFIFSMDGDRKYSLDELEDGSSYVVSSFNKFKVREYLITRCCCWSYLIVLVRDPDKARTTADAASCRVDGCITQF